MRNLFLIILVVSIVACKQTSELNKGTENKENVSNKLKKYPENISRVFKAHGGLSVWETMNTLKFTKPKGTGREVTTVHLKNRKSLISLPNHLIGFDGENVWLKNKDTIAYKGNAKFYYNLMFYFYAMPFVLADNGIAYNSIEPLVFEGKEYPGIKISYNAGVGESSDDEYVLYYNPKTYKMEWLGYTVTYFSKKKSKEFHFIKYTNWQTVNGLLLPETLSWYKSENNLPTTKRNDLKFFDVTLLQEEPLESLFDKPKGAEIF